MPVFKIHHITKYEYDRPVRESMNEIKIFPYQCAEQEVLQHDLIITCNPEVQTFFDYWGNKTGLFNVLPKHNLLSVESKVVVRTIGYPTLNVNFETGFDVLAEEIKKDMKLMELATTHAIDSTDIIDDILKQIHTEGDSIATVVANCGRYIYHNFKYIKGITNVSTTVDEILKQRVGVCQDFAHVMLQLLRTLQIPARYVSGYICPNKNGMRGVGATHAWVEAYIPKYGWAGIDPTNNVWVTNLHVKLAVGRHFRDVSPVKGTFKGPAKQKLSVYVAVSYEDGQMFEEMNDVDLKTQHNNPPEEVLIEDLDAQEQQQQ